MRINDKWNGDLDKVKINEEAFSRDKDTDKNLVYDLAHHGSPIAQWLDRPTGIWKFMGSTPVGSSESLFTEYLT